MIMSRAENIYNIADNHARTVQVCIDRLHDLGANEQLKVLTERLQKLAVRATAEDDHKRNQSLGGMTEGDGSLENPLACARTADNLFWRHHIHHAPDRRGDIGVAARGARAAGGDADGLVRSFSKSPTDRRA
jgi:hypothetical protein